MDSLSTLQIPFDTIQYSGVRLLEPEVLGRFETGGQVGAIRLSGEVKRGSYVAGATLLSNRDPAADPLLCSYAVAGGDNLCDAFCNLLVSYHESLRLLKGMASRIYALSVSGSIDEESRDLINWLCQRLMVNPGDPIFYPLGVKTALVYEGYAVLDLGPEINLTLNGQIHQTSLQGKSTLIVESMLYKLIEHDGEMVRFPFSRFIFGGFQCDVFQWFVKNMQFLEGGYLCLKDLIQKKHLSDLLIQKGA